MTTAQMDELDDLRVDVANPPRKEANRKLYRNVAAICGIAELLTLAVIFTTWLLIAAGVADFGGPLSNAVVTGVFSVCGLLIGMATLFAPHNPSENTGATWYPNVLLLLAFAAFDSALMLAMAVWAVLTANVAPEYVIVGAVAGFLFGFITAVLSLAGRFVPRDE